MRSSIEFALFANRRLQGLGISPREAIELAANYQERAQRSASFSELAEELIEAKRQAGRSHRHERDLKSKLGRFGATFGDRSVSTIESSEIIDWLHQLQVGAGSINSYRRILNLAFKFAMKRGYRVDNPVSHVERMDSTQREVEILTVQEIRLLLEAAEPPILPAIAIAAFAGLRASEIEGTKDHPGLKWAEIDFDEGTILVRAEVAKGRSRRHVPISDNLRSWLIAAGHREGNLWPKNGRKLFEAAKRAAGFGGDRSESQVTHPARPWPRNGLRHCYASYHLARYRNPAELVLNLGHHDDADTLFNHYRGLVKPSDADAYWSITPVTATNMAPS
ncbi:MAG: tyrosine-type recombinase/integrase [Verrucomicrobiae bacterium]|nr:tyrosine-type recombinase/integrase [Verrucomicrobiae bacterium]